MENETQQGQRFPADNLSLQEHFDLLGIDAGMVHRLSNAQIPQEVLDRALRGGHITRLHAEKLCAVLSAEHGVSHAHARGIQPEDIRGLNVWNLHEKHNQPKEDAPLFARQK